MSPFEMLEIKEHISLFDSLLTKKNEKIKWASADLLTYYYTKTKNYQQTIKLLNHQDKDIRQEAAGTLTRIYSDITPLFSTLKGLLNDDFNDVRIVAARTLVNKAENISEISDTFVVVEENLQNENPENRVYAAGIVYSIINLLFNEKSRKDDFNLIQNLIPMVEKSLKDNEEKVVILIAKSLIRYYLAKNMSDKVIEIFEKFPNNKELLIKDIEPKEIPKNEQVMEYVAGLQSVGLKDTIQKAINSNAAELRLSAEDFKTVKIVKLPKEIGNITSLKKLYLSQNSLKSLPEEIGNLTELENLTITCNQLESLPHTIGKLQNLHYLYLYRNKLKNLPVEIGYLKNLKFLQLTQNQINNVPNEIGCLENLTDLNLEDNNLTELPASFGNLQNLKRLDLRGNKIIKFLAEMENLQNLDLLMLINNNLNEIPEFVFKFKNLTYLNVTFNNLTAFPVELTELKNLKTLELRNNKIKEIPEEISKLQNLSTLDLTNNQLTSLPHGLKKLRNLKFLNLNGNKSAFLDKLDLNIGRAQAILKQL